MAINILGSVVLFWVLLGGLFIEIHEELLAGHQDKGELANHDIWLQPTVPPTRFWFLGISKYYVGGPFYLKISSVLPETTGDTLFIDEVRLVYDSGKSTNLLKNGSVPFKYENDTYLAPAMWAFGTVCDTPLRFQDYVGCKFEIRGRIVRSNGSTTDLAFQFDVRQEKRVVRVLPFWLAIYEYSQAR